MTRQVQTHKRHSVPNQCNLLPQVASIWPYVAGLLICFNFRLSCLLGCSGLLGHLRRFFIILLATSRCWYRCECIQFDAHKYNVNSPHSAILFVGTELSPAFHFTPHDCFIWQVFQGVSAFLIIIATDLVLVLRGTLLGAWAINHAFLHV